MCPIFVGSVYNFGRSNDDTSDKIISDKMLISHRCISGLMPNLMKKSWTVSSTAGQAQKRYFNFLNKLTFNLKTKIPIDSELLERI